MNLTDILKNIPESVWGGLIGGFLTLGGVVLRWVFTIDSRKRKVDQAEEKHRKQIEESSFKLATQLRDEMRADNVDLRERQAKNEAKIESLVTDNQTLRKENMDLKGENGALREKAENQAKQIAELQYLVGQLKTEREILIEAMRLANVPLPVELYRKPVTGPLGKS